MAKNSITLRAYQTEVRTDVLARLQQTVQHIQPDTGQPSEPDYQRYSILIEMEFVLPESNQLATLWVGRVERHVWGFCDVRPAWIVKVTGDVRLPDAVDNNMWVAIRLQVDELRFADEARGFI
jgi:hypothetical protein